MRDPGTPAPAHAAMRPSLLALARWLWAVAGLIVLMVAIGGITRLTESGLSITRWEPISGVIPPLNQAQWEAEFAHYRQIDQYATVHAGMTLEQFKSIFFWEYLHRLWGRLIGFAYAIPLIWFAWRKAIPAGYGWKLTALLALGGLQGLFGWLMVRSGLEPGMTAVAPIWLSIHLMTAFLTLAAIAWIALDLQALARDSSARPASLNGFGALCGAVVAIQLFYGALMAGMHAGLVAADWPLMNGAFWPGMSREHDTLAGALFDDPAFVHFFHRWWAWATVAALVVLARKVRPTCRPASIAIHSAFGIQILLGIATVMMHVPIWLAALHQFIGALLVLAVAWGIHCLGRRA